MLLLKGFARWTPGSLYRELPIATSLDPMEKSGPGCSAAWAGGHSAQDIPTQRPNPEVSTDHSNFQRAVIKLLKLNVLVNKTF